MNVYPRKPLEADRGGNWRVYSVPAATPTCTYHTDAEFAEHFYPAERLDTLLAALDAWDQAACDIGDRATGELLDAWRAFREQVTA